VGSETTNNLSCVEVPLLAQKRSVNKYERFQSRRNYQGFAIPACTEEPFLIVLHGHRRDRPTVPAHDVTEASRLVTKSEQVNVSSLKDRSEIGWHARLTDTHQTPQASKEHLNV
jgi:hypothetical protein